MQYPRFGYLAIITFANKNSAMDSISNMDQSLLYRVMFRVNKSKFLPTAEWLQILKNISFIVHFCCGFPMWLKVTKMLPSQFNPNRQRHSGLTSSIDCSAESQDFKTTQYARQGDVMHPQFNPNKQKDSGLTSSDHCLTGSREFTTKQ